MLCKAAGTCPEPGAVGAVLRAGFLQREARSRQALTESTALFRVLL